MGKEKKTFERDFAEQIVDQLIELARKNQITILQDFYFFPKLKPQIYAVVNACRVELETKGTPQRDELIKINKVNNTVKDVFQADPSIEPYEFRVVPLVDEGEKLEMLISKGFTKIPFSQEGSES